MEMTKEEKIMIFLRKTIASLTKNPVLEDRIDTDQYIKDIGMDSVLIINLIVQIELQYEIVFDDDELLTENFATLKVISDQIQSKLSVSL